MDSFGVVNPQVQCLTYLGQTQPNPSFYQGRMTIVKLLFLFISKMALTIFYHWPNWRIQYFDNQQAPFHEINLYLSSFFFFACSSIFLLNTYTLLRSWGIIKDHQAITFFRSYFSYTCLKDPFLYLLPLCDLSYIIWVSEGPFSCSLPINPVPPPLGVP